MSAATDSGESVAARGALIAMVEEEGYGYWINAEDIVDDILKRQALVLSALNYGVTSEVWRAMSLLLNAARVDPILRDAAVTVDLFLNRSLTDSGSHEAKP